MAYCFCYKDSPIGIITENHLGLGWMSTFMTPTEHFPEHREFILALRNAYKLPAYSEELKTELKRLRKIFGPEITDPGSWTIRDENQKVVQRMSTVPVITEHEGYMSARWKKKG